MADRKYNKDMIALQVNPPTIQRAVELKDRGTVLYLTGKRKNEQRRVETIGFNEYLSLQECTFKPDMPA
jgi:hypothetical protein